MRLPLPGRHVGRLSILVSFVAAATAAAQPPQSAPDVVSVGPLRLDDVVTVALQRNPSVDVARHRWAAAAALPPGVDSLPDPELRLGLYGQPLGSLDPLDGQLRLQLTQQFPHPGTLDRRAAVAEREAERVATEIPGSRVLVAAMARRAYQDLYLAERAREIHHGHLQLVRELSESTEERYAAGEVPQENVLRALQELTALFIELEGVDRDVATARSALNRVLHRPPAAALGSPEAPALDQLSGYRLDALLAAAETSSPALREAMAMTAREAARLESDRYERKPDFGLTLQWWTASDGMGGRTERYSLLGTLTLPWLHDAKYTASVDAAISAHDAAEARVLSVRDGVLEGVTRAWERAGAAARIAELYRTTLLPQSEQSLRAARSAYQTGRAEFVTVVDNERTLLLNRLGLARIEAEYGRAIADLLEAVGVTRWNEVPETDTVEEEPEKGTHRVTLRASGGAR